MDKKDRLAQPDAVINGMPAYEGSLSKSQRLAQPEQPDWSKAGFGKPQPESKVYSDIDEMFRDMGVPVTEAEPVAWVRWDNEETYWDVRRNPPSDEAVQYLKSIKRPPWVPAYPHPPQREWQGLTDEEIIAMRHMRDWTAGWTDIRYARAIEAKLREKNA